ncbi:MAG: group II intron reverse transcriptase/maturase [Solibacillus sp.]|uniref:group II intron reverse transcriptase/maturase n=1 Tax=unclassified Solibacillus TaxID=2637870 RepID=UPI0030FBDCC8
MQKQFDMLYARSVDGQNFYDLLDIMQSRENIQLAYRNIKKNTGSKTAGYDGQTIEDIKQLKISTVVSTIQNMFAHYRPQPVRRVFIPKANGKTRPLGIPTIWDRLFQQCILQVLEPICEARFYKHSYGFRPNRSTHHAKARFETLINRACLYHCVDVDIKGFFDNVHHAKLLKQMWTIGIRDKAVLSIISRLLKAEIMGEGFPTKGTPQGGILSPLLSNIVLNELDWWVSNQWENFETKNAYKNKVNMNQALKKSNLKHCYIVRYADDFKIICRTRSQAIRMFYAVKDFLSTRLKLEISEEKSKVVNLKKNSSEFLGFRIKAHPKKTTKRTLYVAHSHMTKKALNNAQLKLKKAVKTIQKHQCVENAWRFNTVVMGIQNYYAAASHITDDLNELNYRIHRTLHNRLKGIRKEAKFQDLTKSLQKRYKGYECNLYKIKEMVLVPIHAQRCQININFSQSICNYTTEGRNKIHHDLRAIDKSILTAVMQQFIPQRSIEYNDNRISRFIAQYGKCAVTGVELSFNDWHCHHKTPYYLSQDDSYSNLIIVHKSVHRLIHLKDLEKIQVLMKVLQLDKKQLMKVNELRGQCLNDAI